MKNLRLMLPLALVLSVSAHPVQAALIKVDIQFTVPSGFRPAAGEVANGFFTFDTNDLFDPNNPGNGGVRGQNIDRILAPNQTRDYFFTSYGSYVPKAYIAARDFELNFLGQTFTNADDKNGFASIFFDSAFNICGLGFTPKNVSPRTAVKSFELLENCDDFTYFKPREIDFFNGTGFYIEGKTDFPKAASGDVRFAVAAEPTPTPTPEPSPTPTPTPEPTPTPTPEPSPVPTPEPTPTPIPEPTPTPTPAPTPEPTPTPTPTPSTSVPEPSTLLALLSMSLGFWVCKQHR
jgi:hypothetical protein